MEIILRDHSSHNPRIEAGLAENKKAPSEGHMALTLKEVVVIAFIFSATLY